MTDTSPTVNAIHVSGKNGRLLCSIFVRADDSYQVVDERGGRSQVIDTAKQPEAPAAEVQTLEAFS